MTIALNARPFEAADLPIYAAWFEDEELRRRIDPPDGFWLEHVSRTDQGNRCYCLTLVQDVDLIAVVQYDFEDFDRVSLLISVRPDSRGRGVGRAALLRTIPELAPEVRYIDSYVEPDNLASLALIRRMGFEPIEENIIDEGFMGFRLYVDRS